ncbi:MAG: response regulator [Actinomycetota bacterium]
MKTEVVVPPSTDRPDLTCPNARILVVDDGGANVELLERVLTGAGYTHVRGFTDPNELMRRIDQDAPDLIFLDLHLPLDGLGLIRALRTRFPKSVDLPIVVLTADVTQEAKHRSLLAGASDFLTKPLDRTEVLCRAANLLEAHDLHRRLLNRQVDLESLVAEQTEKLQERLYDLGRLDQERRKLLSHLVHAEEEERRTIASDIHDDPIQKMVAASMRLDMVLEDHPELAADEQFHKAQDTVDRSIESLRTMMFQLRPYVLDHDGLAAALAVFVVEEGKLPGSATYKVQSHLQSEPPESVRVILYRIAQEALVNVRKHAHATQVEITLEEGDEGYTLQVKDDGVGFERSEISDPSLGHIGLTSMRERASLAGGWFRIDGTGGTGTIAEAWIPRAEDGAAA